MASNPQELLIYAATEGLYMAIKYAIEHGANIEAVDKYGNTPLINAAMLGSKSTTITLFKHGANINARNEEGDTALIAATRRGLNGMVTTLIDIKADIDAGDNEGYTALMFAAIYNNKNIALTLIASGANIDAKNNFGRTARSYCKKLLKNEEVVNNYLDQLGEICRNNPEKLIQSITNLTTAGAKIDPSRVNELLSYGNIAWQPNFTTRILQERSMNSVSTATLAL
jgi:ankyrin repeat protein